MLENKAHLICSNKSKTRAWRDNLFDYKDPENIPNYPGRVIYSKLNFKL